MGKLKYNEKLSKEEQVWRVLFQPKAGDFIEVITQWSGKHRKIKGYVERVVRNEKGSIYYQIRVTFCKPMSRWGKPKRIRIRGNQRIKILVSEWLDMEDVKKDSH